MARKLFIQHRCDGLGARASSINAGMALAAKHGMNFGGLLNCKKRKRPHGVDALPLLKALYGADSFFLQELPAFSKTFKSLAQMEAFFENGSRLPEDGANVLLKVNRTQTNLQDYILRTHRTMNAYFTPMFLDTFRQASHITHDRTPLFKPDRPTVAIHLRRGDVSASMPIRFTNDKFSFSLAEQLRKHLKNPDIHVWSSTEGHHAASEFREYEHQGMTVHLDTPEREAWAHFAQADVLVLAKSTFSHAPAFLNPKCVIYQSYSILFPLDEWAVASGVDTTLPAVDDADLERCLARFARSEKEVEAEAGAESRAIQSHESRDRLMRRATMQRHVDRNLD